MKLKNARKQSMKTQSGIQNGSQLYRSQSISAQFLYLTKMAASNSFCPFFSDASKLTQMSKTKCWLVKLTIEECLRLMSNT